MSSSASKQKEKNTVNLEKAWEILFEKYDIVNQIRQNGFFQISATQINTVKEARLMAKFDQSTQLPKIFRECGFTILPVTRGEYLIGSFSTYAKVHYDAVHPKPVEIPNLQTLDYTNLYSESSALLFAYNSGIMQDIMQADKIHFTVNGRMSSGAFDYWIHNAATTTGKQNIQVQNAQIEIDAGYESEEIFCLCEAKNIAVDEILIRQLYYPYRLWQSKISKPVVPVFLVYSNDIFHAFIYAFADDMCYNSLTLLEHKAYTFGKEQISFEEIVDLWRKTKPTPEPSITFPQANSFTRIIDLLSVLFQRDLTRDAVTLQYEFAGRQTNYYIAACEYLGLIERGYSDSGKKIYRLTKECRSMMQLRYKLKYMALIQKILQCPVFYQAFGLAIATQRPPSEIEVCNIMQKANLSIQGSTIPRRSSTVRGWIDWIIRQSQ